MAVRFRTPGNFYICGQSQCGKSYLVRRILNHLDELFYPVPTKIIYCYGEYQQMFDEMMQTIRNISFVQRFPSDLYDIARSNSLIVVDDLMSQCSKVE